MYYEKYQFTNTRKIFGYVSNNAFLATWFLINPRNYCQNYQWGWREYILMYIHKYYTAIWVKETTSTHELAWKGLFTLIPHLLTLEPLQEQVVTLTLHLQSSYCYQSQKLIVFPDFKGKGSSFPAETGSLSKQMVSSGKKRPCMVFCKSKGSSLPAGKRSL